MKLGGVKPKTVKASLADTLADEWNDEDDGEVENAWGNEDLIDVNADEDDWAAFESAPVPEIVAAPEQSYYVKPTPAPTAKPAPIPAVRAAPVVRAPAARTPVLAPKIQTPAPTASPVTAGNDEWDVDNRSATASPAGTAAQPSLAGMSKEEKDKEMARRREERKAVSPR
jgi:SCY1-like protein 1